MTIKSFDRTNLQALRNELTVALADIGAKHDIIFTVGNMRFSEGEVRMKVEAKTNAAKFSPNSSPDIARLAKMYNLPDDLIGRKVQYGVKIMTIIGAKMSRPKYPFIVEDVLGGKYKMSVNDIRDGLI